MKWLLQVVPAIVISWLMVGVLIAFVGLCFKAWYLIFMLGWNAL